MSISNSCSSIYIVTPLLLLRVIYLLVVLSVRYDDPTFTPCCALISQIFMYFVKAIFSLQQKCYVKFNSIEIVDSEQAIGAYTAEFRSRCWVELFLFK